MDKTADLFADAEQAPKEIPSGASEVRKDKEEDANTTTDPCFFIMPTRLGDHQSFQPGPYYFIVHVSRSLLLLHHYHHAWTVF